MAMYIFQFGFLQPIASIANSQMPIAGFSLLLLFAMLINNGFRVKTYVVISFIIVSVYFLLNAIIKDNTVLIMSIYGEFIVKSFSAFIIASMTVNGDELYNSFLKLSVVNFVAIVLFPFVGFLNSMNYMRFGYAMIPSVIMFFYASFHSKSKKILWVLLTIVSCTLTIIYGSRGPIGILLIFASLLFIFSKKATKLRKFLILSITSISLFTIIKFQLTKKILDYLYFGIGIRSYALEKLKMMITVGFSESSSGRDVMYSYIIQLIKDNPIIGYGIGIVQANLNSTAHNIILQILIESGFIGLIIWIIVWILFMERYIKMSRLQELGLFRVVTLIVSISVGRLLFSSDMWLRPEYWFALSMFISFNYKNIKGGVSI